MKRMTCLILLMCMLVSCAHAESYTSEIPRICTPEEVDVSRVRLENGRLVGEVVLPESAGKIRLLVDCPLPEAFPQEKRQRLTVSFRKVTKEQLKEAIAAIGQSGKDGELRQFISDPLNRMAAFELEKELSYASVIPVETHGHAKQVEMEKAKQILRELAVALNVSISEAFLSAQRNTFEALNRINPGESSASSELIERNERNFLAQEKKYGGRDGEDTMTLLRAMYELDGLPVMNQRYWRQGSDAFGASSEMLAAVHDDGRLVLAEVWGVPVVEKSEPVETIALDWQSFLREWVSAAYRPSCRLEEYVENSVLFGEVIHYGGYEVITCIAPCWVGREAFTLEPGWYGVTQQRLLKDDSLVYEHMQYVSAVDFARVF